MSTDRQKLAHMSWNLPSSNSAGDNFLFSFSLLLSKMITKLKYSCHDIVVMCIKCELVAIIRKRMNLHTLKSTGLQEITSSL
jgi:hypothetical protein